MRFQENTRGPLVSVLLVLASLTTVARAGVIGFEAGSVALNNTLDVPEFTAVSFAQSYAQAPPLPVRVAATSRSPSPAVLRRLLRC